MKPYCSFNPSIKAYVTALSWLREELKVDNARREATVWLYDSRWQQMKKGI